MVIPPLPPAHSAQHRHSTCGNPLLPPPGDLLRVGSRRWFLQTGLAGFAGLTLADTLRAKTPTSPTSKTAVILFWLSGGPYKTIATSVPGIRFCEHRPVQAKLAHKLTVSRCVDCSASNHTLITMQAG